MHDAECTYDVLVMMSLANIAQENDNFCSTIASELKCRAKGEDSLSCHFQNSRIRHPGREDSKCTNAMDFVPTRTRFVDEGPFEIRFNPRGIENLVVHRTIPRWQLDMIKVIVSQLNVGFEVSEHRNRFTIMENSTVGYCEVDVKVTRGGSDEEHDDHDDNYDEDDRKEGKAFEIEFMTAAGDEMTRSIDDKLHVQKLRQPKRCPRRTIYFFGNEEDYSRGDRELYMDMV